MEKTLEEYILELDSMTTYEFCREHGIAEPRFTGDVKTSATTFLQIDSIKYRLIKEFAKQ